MTWIAVGASVAGAAGSAISSNNAADAQSRVTKAQRDQANMQFNARKQAWENQINTGKGYQQEGEQGFLGETAAPLAELGQAKTDVLQGSAEGLNQASGEMNANLTKEGVRGGQASTLMNRGIGQMGEDTQRQINEMALQDAQTRRQMRGSFFGNKAQAGQQTASAMPAF